MPAIRRSVRLKRTKAAAAAAVTGVDRFYTREKKRGEIIPLHHLRSPSADRDLQLVISGIRSDDCELQLDATTQLLNLISVQEHPLIDEVVQSGAVPRLVEFLKCHNHPQLQCEAARVLKNIASEKTEVVIDSGAVPVFVKLLESSELDTCEQVAWCLGNIASESFRCRNVVLKCGALPPLLTLLEKHDSLSFQRTCTWTLTNIFEGGPKVPMQQLEFAIRVLASLIRTNDEEVLKEACWALLYLCKCGGGIETAMYEAGLCLELAKLLEHAPLLVLFPALRSIGSILNRAKMVDKRILEVGRYLSSIDREDIDAHFLKDKRCCKRFVGEIRLIQSWVNGVEAREYALSERRGG